MLVTNHCILQLLQPSDYESILRLYRNEKVRKYLGGTVPEHKIRENFQHLFASGTPSCHWTVREKSTESFIGTVSLDLHHDGDATEISYQFLPLFWGKGYATEAVQTVIDYGFATLGLPEIVAETQTENERSRRLLERLGMEESRSVERFGEQQTIHRLLNLN
ncbi:GNAT family N-acetyltransferase [Sediminibacillus dalangtanensis]|uniref:GNAT family N-acetyltransferase n=1 Tax=Sediminibacillus dalangtanensis TaxID=2729421 RepID=A0ABX7VTL1_9BACI|nr:GNAT family N-acetyltransferase [Sediminibacillus dalangtanensis]QTM98930.1 GNAT family N-acetyltransferase [Sediminibacillus dalangtanensis]